MSEAEALGYLQSWRWVHLSIGVVALVAAARMKNGPIEKCVMIIGAACVALFVMGLPVMQQRIAELTAEANQRQLDREADVGSARTTMSPGAAALAETVVRKVKSGDLAGAAEDVDGMIQATSSPWQRRHLTGLRMALRSLDHESRRQHVEAVEKGLDAVQLVSIPDSWPQSREIAARAVSLAYNNWATDHFKAGRYDVAVQLYDAAGHYFDDPLIATNRDAAQRNAYERDAAVARARWSRETLGRADSLFERLATLVATQIVEELVIKLIVPRRFQPVVGVGSAVHDLFEFAREHGCVRETVGGKYWDTGCTLQAGAAWIDGR